MTGDLGGGGAPEAAAVIPGAPPGVHDAAVPVVPPLAMRFSTPRGPCKPHQARRRPASLALPEVPPGTSARTHCAARGHGHGHHHGHIQGQGHGHGHGQSHGDSSGGGHHEHGHGDETSGSHGNGRGTRDARLWSRPHRPRHRPAAATRRPSFTFSFIVSGEEEQLMW